MIMSPFSFVLPPYTVLLKDGTRICVNDRRFQRVALLFTQIRTVSILIAEIATSHTPFKPLLIRVTVFG